MLAQDYQRRSELFPGWREALVSRLALRPGDTVIDAGAGPGLNLPALRSAVGPYGTVVALEACPRLLGVAAQRVSRRGWDNIELINARPDTARLALRADAALIAGQLLSSEAMVANVMAHLRPGARVAAGGWSGPPPAWLWPLRAMVAIGGRRATALVGLDRPWRHPATQATAVRVEHLGLGTGYLATAAAPNRNAPTHARRSGE